MSDSSLCMILVSIQESLLISRSRDLIFSQNQWFPRTSHALSPKINAFTAFSEPEK